jgi:hypothetical protein
MDDDVRQRLTALEEKLNQLGLDLQESLGNVERSPAATCIQVGVAVEHMLRRLWKKVGLSGSPDEKRFEDLLRLTTKKLDDDGEPMPREIVTAIREIQLRRNDAAHYWGIVKRSAATNSLGNLADVTHWYFARFLPTCDERAGHADGPVAPASRDPKFARAPVQDSGSASSPNARREIPKDGAASLGESRGTSRSLPRVIRWRRTIVGLTLCIAVGVGIVVVLLVTNSNLIRERLFDRHFPDERSANIGQERHSSATATGRSEVPRSQAPPDEHSPVAQLERQAAPTVPGPTAPKLGAVKNDESRSTDAEQKVESHVQTASDGAKVKAKDPVKRLDQPKAVAGSASRAASDRNSETRPVAERAASLPPIPEGVRAKIHIARKAVAAAVVAAREAGLVETSIDPPPILDILINGRATDLRVIKATPPKKPYGVSPEVFGAWFCGYGKLDGVNFVDDVRIMNPSGGLKTYYDRRAAIFSRHIAAVKAGKDSVEVRSSEIPREVEAKLEIARRAVAELIVAAQSAGLVETSIDPPPILDILIMGRATDLRAFKATPPKKPYGVSPEVFSAWFCGYGKVDGVNYMDDVRIFHPSAGGKAYYDQRARMLEEYIREIHKSR